MKHLITGALIAIATLPLNFCGTAIAGETQPLSVSSWGYQLQEIRPAAIARAKLDLIIIDYSSDGSDTEAYSRDQVTYMKGRENEGKHKLISYFSIGEAESYRGYWKSAWKRSPPAWLGKANSNWDDNYRVNYWEPEWQSILFGSTDAYLDKILAAGFDGVFLDKVDAFEEIAAKRPSAEEEMINLVIKLAAYARKQRPDFLVFVQNGETLLADPAYLAVIDGIAKEDLFFGLNEEQEPNPDDEILFSSKYLDLAIMAGKPVLTVDYVEDKSKIRQAMLQSRDRGYVPITTDRELNKLQVK